MTKTIETLQAQLALLLQDVDVYDVCLALRSLYNKPILEACAVNLWDCEPDGSYNEGFELGQQYERDMSRP